MTFGRVCFLLASMDLMTTDEALAFLDVHPKTLVRYIKEGLIQPVAIPGKTISRSNSQFNTNDVCVLKKFIDHPKMSLGRITTMSQRAFLQSKQHTKILNWLMCAIGCDGSMLSLEEEDLQSLHDKAERELDRDTFLYSVDEVFNWARTFQLMGEEYLEALSLFLDIERPWQVYSRLSATMLKHRPTKGDPELMMAYNSLDASRRELRRAGFFFAYNNYGKHIAYSLFPEAVGDFHQHVLSSILLHDRAREKATLDKRSRHTPDISPSHRSSSSG